jgi:hypothetical protein
VADESREPSRTAAANHPGWIVSPLFDVLFFSNIYWVAAFLPIYVSPDGEPYVQFWMAYFLATPHRWLTLVVAATDRDRRHGQTWLFVAIAIFFALLIGLTLWATGDFRHLFLFYTLLLGWHFAGQHSGILKIYAGKSGGGIRWMEDWLPMVFIMYTNIRLVAFLEPLIHLPRLNLLGLTDSVILVIPAMMLSVELVNFSPLRIPKLLYMISFFGMWSAVLWSAHVHRNVLCSVLLAAVTVYHSVEYLALVSYYAWRRRELGTAGLFQKMARNWTVIFAWYVVGSGLLYAVGNALFVVACYAINTWASLLHCAYDGIMWRFRDPETAEVFDMATSSRGPTC